MVRIESLRTLLMMKNIITLLVWGLIGTIATQTVAVEPESDLAQDTKSLAKRPSLLLVEQDQHPSAEVSWVVGGERQSYSATLPYTAPTGGDPLGHNVKAYVTLGGTRIETGAGHPKGAVIRLGITKIEGARAFFSKIDPGTDIEFTITDVRMNQPVKYHEGTGMMHLKYSLGDLKACALPGTARNQYLLSDPQDTLGGRVIAGLNATPGALDGHEGNGSIMLEVDKDDPTLVTMRVRVPYGLLRHLQDPWKSTLPGTFFEPIHLHAEAELIPVDVERLVREPIVPESNEGSKDLDSTEESNQEAIDD